MTAGRGYSARRFDFAKWRPWYALMSCLLFGLQAIALRPDLIETYLSFKVQVQLLDVLPYILTVIILAGFVGKAIPTRRWRTLRQEDSLSQFSPLQFLFGYRGNLHFPNALVQETPSSLSTSLIFL